MRRVWGPRCVRCCGTVALALVLIAVAAATASAAGSRGRATFTTPGYRWDGTLPKVAPVVPGKLIKVLGAMDRMGMAVSPVLFSYQMLFELEPV